MNIWIGGNWARSGERKKLLLGESWYGPEESLQCYIQRWCEGTQCDRTFTRIFNACSGLQAATASVSDKLNFWDGLAFMNFVYWSVGPTNAHKAGPTHFRAAQADLDRFLKVLQPDVVWILGLTQGSYSTPIVSRLGIKAVVSIHPTAWGVTNAVLHSAYRRL